MPNPKHFPKVDEEWEFTYDVGLPTETTVRYKVTASYPELNKIEAEAVSIKTVNVEEP